LERSFYISAQPSIFVFSHNLFKGYFSYFLNDILYFAGKYFYLFKPYNFPTNKIISSLIYHVPLEESSFVVPVTLTAISEFYLNFGFTVSMFLILFTGYIFGWLYSKSCLENKHLQIGILIIFQEALIEFINKGNLIYIVFNYLFVLILTLLSYRFLNLMLRSLISTISQGKKVQNSKFSANNHF